MGGESLSIFFGYPIYLPPLTKQQTLEALERRYQILATKENIIKPAEETFIESLYDLYNGKIRCIMDAMTLVVPEFSKPETIATSQAYAVLKRLVAERVQRILTAQEVRFLNIGNFFRAKFNS